LLCAENGLDVKRNSRKNWENIFVWWGCGAEYSASGGGTLESKEPAAEIHHRKISEEF
jgi:hypothetical protein